MPATPPVFARKVGRANASLSATAGLRLFIADRQRISLPSTWSKRRCRTRRDLLRRPRSALESQLAAMEANVNCIALHDLYL